MLTIGIDLGSTTVKYALLSESGVLLSHDYVRHGSAVKQTLEKVLRALALRTHDAPSMCFFRVPELWGSPTRSARASCRR